MLRELAVNFFLKGLEVNVSAKIVYVVSLNLRT